MGGRTSCFAARPPPSRRGSAAGPLPVIAWRLLAADWRHPYERAEAAYPMPGDRRAKYWPPVRRIDQAYGDRHLVCACPPPEAFAD